jgi:hypothetical protein
MKVKVMPIASMALIISIVAIIGVVVLRPALALEAGSVGTEEMADNSVTSGKIADGTIVDADISTYGISRIADNAITLGMLTEETRITLENIGENEVTSVNILNGTIETEDIKNSAVTSAKLADYIEVENLHATTLVSTVDLTATGTVNLGTDAIQTAEIQDNQITSPKIAADTIEAADVKENAIGYSELRLKIRSGGSDVGTPSSQIKHNLSRPDNTGITVVAVPVPPTPVVSHVRIESITGTDFTVAIYDNTETPISGRIVWIAVYEPADWT